MAGKQYKKTIPLQAGWFVITGFYFLIKYPKRPSVSSFGPAEK